MTQINGTVLFDASAPKSPSKAEANTARALRDLDAAKAAGFAPEATIYAIGEPVNETGRANFRASRLEHDAKPGREALDLLAERIVAERRRDKVVKAGTLKLTDSGHLVGPAGNPVLLTERAFLQLARNVTPGGAAYLAACEPDLRAHNINRWLGNQDKGHELKLRLRVIDGAPQIFSVVGPRYASTDLDLVAGEIRKALPHDAKVEVMYDGQRYRITVTFHTDVRPEDAVCGEFFKAGLTVYGADDGTGSIVIDATAWRNLCLNLIIIHEARQNVLRRRHTGRTADIVADVRVGAHDALGKIRHFTDAWSAARKVNVVEQYDVKGTDGVRAIYNALLDAERLAAPGGRDVVLDRIMTAWHKEPGYQATDLVNGVTRAAHEATWSSPWVADDLQRQAGALLARPDWARVAPILTA